MPQNTPNQPRNDYPRIKALYEKQKAVDNFEMDTYLGLMVNLKNDAGDGGWGSLNDDRKKEIFNRFNSSIHQKYIDFGGITANPYGQGVIDSLRREISPDQLEEIIKSHPVNAAHGIFQEMGQNYWGRLFSKGVGNFVPDNELDAVKGELKNALGVDIAKVERKDIGSLVANYMSQREALRNYT